MGAFKNIFSNVYRRLALKVLKKFAGLTGEDLDEAIYLVKQAEVQFVGTGRGSEKYAYVKSAMRISLSLAASWAVDLLINIAVSYLKKRDFL